MRTSSGGGCSVRTRMRGSSGTLMGEEGWWRDCLRGGFSPSTRLSAPLMGLPLLMGLAELLPRDRLWAITRAVSPLHKQKYSSPFALGKSLDRVLHCKLGFAGDQTLSDQD